MHRKCGGGGGGGDGLDPGSSPPEGSPTKKEMIFGLKLRGQCHLPNECLGDKGLGEQVSLSPGGHVSVLGVGLG